MSVMLSIPEEAIASRIHVVREIKVMLDSDLAELYGVPTKQLNQQVKRNIERFPKDFMFQLKARELAHLRSQIVTSRSEEDHGGRRTLPRVFTEHGVLMLSSVLNNERAVQVNIHIMRVFVRLNRLLRSDAELAVKLQHAEGRLDLHEGAIQELFTHVERLGQEKELPRKRLGYRGGDAV
jgi:hypothetical protein